MNRFLLLALTAGLLSTTAVNADLGAAEKREKVVLDVWCGEKGNDCKVTFDGQRIRVNDGKGITADQILFTQYDSCATANSFLSCNSKGFTITYKKANGSRGSGTFIISNLETAKTFRTEVERMTGREIGTAKTVDIEETRNQKDN